MNELQLAGCILLDEKGALLLLHRNTDKYTHWEVPGGKVEQDEKLETAAIREIQEELGVVVQIERKLGEATFVDGKPIRYHWFLATTAGTPKVCEPDTFDDLAYFSTEELLNSDLSLSEGAKTFASLVQGRQIRL